MQGMCRASAAFPSGVPTPSSYQITSLPLESAVCTELPTRVPPSKNPMTSIRKNSCMKESLAYVQRKKSPSEKYRPYTFRRPSCPQKQSLAIRQPLKDQRQEPAHETQAAPEDRRLLSELWAAKVASPWAQYALSFSCCGQRPRGLLCTPVFMQLTDPFFT